MGKKRFLLQTDFGGNELQNAVLQNLFQFPVNPYEGQILYRSDLKFGFIWNGTDWVPMGVPPVAQFYEDLDSMIADQENQFQGFLYYDGENAYIYLGTKNQEINDYLKIINKNDLDNFVSYDKDDNKSEPEKQQARENINVYSKWEVKEITGLRSNLNTNSKDNLVQGINESNSWRVIEW